MTTLEHDDAEFDGLLADFFGEVYRRAHENGAAESTEPHSEDLIAHPQAEALQQYYQRQLAAARSVLATAPKPIENTDAEALWKRCEDDKAQLAAIMPDDKAALRVLSNAYVRLKDLGWKEACYCPKDGSTFHSISVGSTGIGDTCYQGDWPTGKYWELYTLIP